MLLPRPFLINLTKIGATVLPTDIDHNIPAVVNQTLTIPDNLENVGQVYDPAVIQRRTHIFTLGVNQGASVASTASTVDTFGTGLWRIAGHFTYDQDFASGANFSLMAALQFVSPAGAALIVARVMDAVANTPVTIAFNYEVLFTSDGWLLQFLSPATGVGQGLALACAGLATKIL